MTAMRGGRRSSETHRRDGARQEKDPVAPRSDGVPAVDARSPGIRPIDGRPKPALVTSRVTPRAVCVGYSPLAARAAGNRTRMRRPARRSIAVVLVSTTARLRRFVSTAIRRQPARMCCVDSASNICSMLERPRHRMGTHVADLRRAPQPHQLLVPAWGVAGRGHGRAGGRAGPVRARRHRPRRAVRRGPVHHRGRGGRHPARARDRDRAPGSGGAGSRWDRAARPAQAEGPEGGARAGRRCRRDGCRHRGPARAATAGSRPAAGSSAPGQGGPARHRRAAARAAPRAARAQR